MKNKIVTYKPPEDSGVASSGPATKGAATNCVGDRVGSFDGSIVGATVGNATGLAVATAAF
jgi:hypothetical protein